ELLKDSAKNVFNRLLERLGIVYTKENILELVEEYRNHMPDISFFDDVLPCLEQLKYREIKTGIITDGYANAQKLKLKAVNAFNYFEEIIVKDELGREYWKPHPKPFEMIKEKLNIGFHEMVYVGDNPEKDFFIKSIYPVKTIRIFRVNGVYNNKPYYNSIEEDYKLNNLTELHQLI